MAKKAKKSTKKKAKSTKKKAKSTKKKATGGGRRGRKPAIGDDAKITVLVKKNPRRKGTRLYKLHNLLKTGMTVGAFIKKGGNRGVINKSIKKKWIKISKKAA